MINFLSLIIIQPKQRLTLIFGTKKLSHIIAPGDGPGHVPRPHTNVQINLAPHKVLDIVLPNVHQPIQHVIERASSSTPTATPHSCSSRAVAVAVPRRTKPSGFGSGGSGRLTGAPHLLLVPQDEGLEERADPQEIPHVVEREFDKLGRVTVEVVGLGQVDALDKLDARHRERGPRAQRGVEASFQHGHDLALEALFRSQEKVGAIGHGAFERPAVLLEEVEVEGCILGLIGAAAAVGVMFASCFFFFF